MEAGPISFLKGCPVLLTPSQLNQNCCSLPAFLPKCPSSRYVISLFNQSYLRCDALGVLTPDTGNKEKHWASIIMGLMDACKLSVSGLKVLVGGTAGPDTKIS